MEFLTELNISSETINLIDEVYSDVEKDEIIMCQIEIVSSIKYLRELGVIDKMIEEILVEDYHILTPGRLYLKKAVAKVNKDALVSALNKDISYSKYLKNFL